MRTIYEINSGRESYYIERSLYHGIIKSKSGEKAILYSDCMGDIDVCTAKHDDLHIIFQNRLGIISHISHNCGSWKKNDIIIPKRLYFYDKKLKICSISDKVIAFFSLNEQNRFLLCFADVNELSRIKIISQINSLFSFDVNVVFNTVITVFENERGELICLFSDTINNKTSSLTILNSGGFSHISLYTYANRAVIAFLHRGIYYLIVIDINLKNVISVFDLGDASYVLEIHNTYSENIFNVYFRLKDFYELISFDIKKIKVTQKRIIKCKKENILRKKLYRNDIITELE